MQALRRGGGFITTGAVAATLVPEVTMISANLSRTRPQYKSGLREFKSREGSIRRFMFDFANMWKMWTIQYNFIFPGAQPTLEGSQHVN